MGEKSRSKPLDKLLDDYRVALAAEREGKRVFGEASEAVVARTNHAARAVANALVKRRKTDEDTRAKIAKVWP